MNKNMGTSFSAQTTRENIIVLLTIVFKRDRAEVPGLEARDEERVYVMCLSPHLHLRPSACVPMYVYIYIIYACIYVPPKGLKGFIPVGPRPTECVLSS